jgi:protein-disulfide isomerase
MSESKKNGSSQPSKTDPRLVASLVAAIAVAAFFGGYSIGDMNDPDTITRGDLDRLLDARDPPPPVQLREEPTLDPNPIIFVSVDDDPIMGNPDAPLTIVEFSDFQCPFCARFHHETLPQIEQEYIQTGKVNFVYRDMPLGMHANAMPAHIAAECANVQDAFWEYHDILFNRQSEWNKLDSDSLESKLIAYAQELDLDSSFTSCINSDSIEQEVMKDYNHATGYGATGTPTFFVGNDEDGYTKLSGSQSFSAFKSVIDSKLNN